MNSDGERLNYSKTLIIGLGYFCINISLCLYGPFIPLFINNYTDSKFVIGLITTIGYIIAALFQPYFGALSDKTTSKVGKRKLYLLIGMPLSALFFLLIPYEWSFISLVIFIIGFNFALSIYRVPSMSLMADTTPEKHWNTANGIINFLGGIGALFAYFVGAKLYEKDKHYPFIMVAAVLILSVILIYSFIKEKSNIIEKKDKEIGVINSFKEIMKNEDKSPLYLLFSIFFRFMGYNGAETFITLYGLHYLHIKAGDAAILLGIMALSFIIFAIPSGILASKIGRKKAITLGLSLLFCAFLIDALFGSFIVIALMGPIAGLGYALININAYPMLLGMADKNRIGVYTGLYYFFYSIAAILAPPLFGKFIDVMGYGVLFFISCVLLLFAMLCFMFVKESDVNLGNKQNINV